MRKLLLFAIVVILAGVVAALWYQRKVVAPSLPPTPTIEAPAPTAEPAPAPATEDTPPAPEPASESETAPAPSPGAVVTVHGTVKDAVSGAPIADALVLALRSDQERRWRSRLEDAAGDDISDVSPGNEGKDNKGQDRNAGVKKPKDSSTTSDASAHSDAAGAYSLPLDATVYRSLACQAEGYSAVKVAIPSSGELDITLDIGLRPGALVSGIVRDAETGAVIEGVSVQLQSTTKTSITDMAAGLDMPESDTESDGTYTIAGVDPGSYQVSVSARKKGYIFRPETPLIVDLQEGEAKENVDLLLEQGATLQGTVRDSSGNAVADAKVGAMPVDFMQSMMKGPSGMLGMKDAMVDGRSDAQGKYELAGLDYDHGYRVLASAENLSGTSEELAPIARGKSPVTLDFVLTTGSKVSGRAHYPDGTPAKTLKVMLMPPLSDLMAGAIQEPKTTKSDDAGTFVFEHVAAGKYTLHQGEINPMTMFAGGADNAPIEVDGVHDVVDVDLVVEPKEAQAKEAQGQGSITGVVLDVSGKPAASIRVEAKGSDNPTEAAGATTDPEGKFKLSGLTGTRYDVSVTGDTGEAEQKSVMVGSLITLHLSPPTRVSGTVVDTAGQPAASCKVTLKSSGETAPQDAMKDFMSKLIGGGAGGKTTDANGFFEFLNVEPGEYTIAAKSPTSGTGASAAFHVAQGQDIANLRITLEAGVRFSGTVVDKNSQPIAGATVTLAETSGGDMERLMAQSMPQSMRASDASATTGADGAFEMASVGPGTYTLTAAHSSYANTIENDLVILAGRDTTGHRVVMTVGGKASGQYLSEGAPKAGVMVQLMGPGGMYMATTDKDGRFDLTGIAPGSYIVNAVDLSRMATEGLAGVQQHPQVVDITDEGSTPIDLGPGPGVTVSGTVQSATPAAPGEGATTTTTMTTISLRRPGGPAPEEVNQFDMNAQIAMIRSMGGTAIARADGSFTMDGVKPGQYILEIHRVDFNPANPDFEALANMDRTPALRQEITVGEEPLTLNLTLPEPAAKP